MRWQNLKSVNTTNIAGAKNEPEGFAAWALKNGAVDQPNAEQ
jgi:hypothetical protein